MNWDLRWLTDFKNNINSLDEDLVKYFDSDFKWYKEIQIKPQEFPPGPPGPPESPEPPGPICETYVHFLQERQELEEKKRKGWDWIHPKEPDDKQKEKDAQICKQMEDNEKRYEKRKIEIEGLSLEKYKVRLRKKLKTGR